MSAEVPGLDSGRLQAVGKLGVLQLDEIRDDFNLLRDHWRLLYAVDPHEIIDFCFPIKPDSPTPSPRHQDISSDQVALNELFNVAPTLPILFPEYNREVRGVADAIRRWIGGAYENAEVVDALIRQADIGSLTPQSGLDEGMLTVIERNFAGILAVLLGIYDVGSRRLFHILGSRLQSDLAKYDEGTLQSIYSSYSETPLAWQIYSVLVESDRRRLAKYPEEIQRQQMGQRLPRHRADSVAIDRLLFLNKSFKAMYEDGRLSRRYLLLYVSSAAKSRFIFSQLAVQRALVKVQGDFYQVLRTREQLFAMAAFRARGKGRRDLEEAVKKLSAFREVVRRVGRLEDSWRGGAPRICDGCVLHGGEESGCRLYSVCSLLMRNGAGFPEQQDGLQNLSFLNNLSVYQHLLKAKPQRGAWREYVEFFGRLYQRKDVLRDRALERIHLEQVIIAGRAQFSSDLLGDLRVIDLEGMIEPRDSVTGASQALPVDLRVKDPEVKELITRFRRALRERFTNPRSLIGVYERFVELDGARGENGLELELLRVLLYQAAPSVEGDRKALDYLERLREVPGATRELRHEMNYLEVWGRRRLKDYGAAVALATRVIGESKERRDLRIVHGRMLAVFAWKTDRARGDCPFNLGFARKDAHEAIELAIASEANPEVLGALLNDLAFLFAIEKRGRPSAIKQARETLEKLKETFPKVGWREGFPEYLHTEAFIEWEEFSILGRKDLTTEMEVKLRSALADISIASRMRPKRAYQELARRIEGVLKTRGEASRVKKAQEV